MKRTEKCRKILSGLLVLSLMLSCVPVSAGATSTEDFVAPQITSKETCTHEGTQTTESMTDSTCTTAGIKTVTCVCGFVISTETLALAQHNYSEETGICTGCSAQKQKPIVCVKTTECPANNHAAECPKHPNYVPPVVCDKTTECAAENHEVGCPKHPNYVAPAVCNKTAECAAESHEAGCPKHPNYVAPAVCAKTAECAAENHEAECPKHPDYVAPVVCDKTADCKAAGNHDAECLKARAEAEAAQIARSGLAYSAVEAKTDLPKAEVTDIVNEELTFAKNFKVVEPTEEQLASYGDWYADFVLTVSETTIFNAYSETADGYLSGQYDTWSENWVNVPFEDVTLTANTPLKIMEYAATLMGQSSLKLTYNDVYGVVKDFNCGVYFTDEFLQAHPNFSVTLELRMYNPENEAENYAIGETYRFYSPYKVPATPVIPDFAPEEPKPAKPSGSTNVPAPPIQVPVSGEEESIRVDATVTGSTATLENISDKELHEVIGSHVETGTVTIDFSELKENIDTVVLHTETIKQIAEAAHDEGNDTESLEIKLSGNVSIEFLAESLAEKAEQAEGKDISISIVPGHKDKSLSEDQKQAIGNRVSYGVTIISGEDRLTDLGGEMIIHVPYQLKQGEKPEGLVVYRVAEDGTLEKCETSYDSEKELISWKTDFLSLYVIDYQEPVE